MRVDRREFMHLLGAQGLGLTFGLACGDDGSGGPMAGSGSTGPQGTGDGTGSSGGPPPGTTSGADSTGSSDDGSSGSSGGETIDCDAQWWLCDDYAPVEETEAFDLRVEGSLPAALQGLYLRNGPNPSTGSSGHWFLGDGMVHGVQLSGGTAQWYRARYVQTPLLGGGTGDPLDPTMHQANTSVVWHAGNLLTLAEVGLPYAISPKDLSTLGVYDYGGALAGPHTAHPKIDPVTGELVFFGYELLMPQARVHFVDPAGALTRTETIALPAPVMMHDFQLTESYVVLMDMPILFDLDLAIAGESMPFAWTPRNGARIGVMPRGGTAADVVWADIEVGYTFHTFNAFEDAMGNVVLDAVWYPQMWVESPGDFATDGAVVRFTVDPVRGTAQRQELSSRRMEFPRIDPRRQGLPHRYGYALTNDAPDDGTLAPWTGVAKIDLLRGTTEAQILRDGLWLDELIFVPDSPGAAEDEGWLVGYGFDPAERTSSLLVLDATSIASGPVARIRLPQRVPHGFHGAWVPSM